MRPGFGLVRNETNIEQSFGLYSIPPRGFAELPADVVSSLLRHPMKELTVLQPDVGPQVFVQTDRLPFGLRYKERAGGTHR